MDSSERRRVHLLDDGIKKRECCKMKENLKYVIGKNNRKDMMVFQCKYCKALHYRAVAETGRYLRKL